MRLKANILIYYKRSTKWVQSGNCILKRLEIASRRIEIVIFRIDKKLRKKKRIEKITCKFNFGHLNFWKSKLIYVGKSERWAQVGFYSSNRLEMASKTVKTFISKMGKKYWEW